MLEHIILDIDECLIHTEEGKWDIFEKLREEGYPVFRIRMKSEEMWALKRPHLDEFLEFCFQEFKTVSIWSAGTTEYVETVVRIIFRDLPRPDLVMTRSHVLWEDPGLEEEGPYTKPLLYYYDKMRRYGANRKNSILVDDKKTNSNYDPYNIIVIPPFFPQELREFQKQDDAFLSIIDWIILKKKNCEESDIRCVNKRSIFSPLSERYIENYLNSLQNV